VLPAKGHELLLLQALLAIGKPGIIWALDRRTGEFLWARETTHQTVYKHVDPETGQVSINESLIPTKLDETKFVCPSFYGGKLWMATAYNPASRTPFVPLNNLCMDYKAVEQQPLPGEDYGRGRMVFRHAPDNNENAINLKNRETQWTQQRRPYWSSSLLATAGGLVFGGDTNRRITAFDAASGKTLWELPLNSQPGGFPMTYMAGGKQYVAIPTGLSLIGNRVVRSLTPEIPVPSADRRSWCLPCLIRIPGNGGRTLSQRGQQACETAGLWFSRRKQRIRTEAAPWRIDQVHKL